MRGAALVQNGRAVPLGPLAAPERSSSGPEFSRAAGDKAKSRKSREQHRPRRRLRNRRDADFDGVKVPIPQRTKMLRSGALSLLTLFHEQRVLWYSSLINA